MLETIPDKLYRYIAIDKNGYYKENLEKSQLYFAPPEKFNAPFDCSLFVDGLKFTDEKLVEIFSDIFNKSLKREMFNKTIPEQLSIKNEWEKDRKRNFPTKEITIKKIKNILKKNTIIHQKDILQKKGVACFSELFNNILMWSHYADSHRGICLEYNTKYFKEDEKDFFVKVEYSDKFPDFMPERIFKKDLTKEYLSEVFRVIRTKSTHWKYEREWRAIHINANTIYKHVEKAISKIIFGAKMEPKYKIIIKNIYKDKNYCPEFIQASLSKTEYKLNFDKYNF